MHVLLLCYAVQFLAKRGLQRHLPLELNQSKLPILAGQGWQQRELVAGQGSLSMSTLGKSM